MSSAPKKRPAARPQPNLTLSSFLPYRLSVVAAVVSEGLARTYMRRFGIAVPEWRVIATIAEFESMTAKAVGRHAHMSKVKISRAAASLEERGLLRRLPNTKDLRESFLVLTPSGKALYAEIAPLALNYVGRLEAAFSDHEKAALDRLLDKLLDVASQRGEGSPASAQPLKPARRS